MAGTGVRIPLEEREGILLPLLVAHARQGVEYVALHAPVEFFRVEGVEGTIPFVSRGKLILGLGEPIASADNQLRLVEEFLWFCKRRSRTPGFFPTTGEFFERVDELGFGGVPVAVEPVVRLGAGEDGEGTMSSVVFEDPSVQLSFGNAGILGVSPDSLALELDQYWLPSEGAGRVGLLIRGDVSTAGGARRFAVARRQGRIVALASMVPVCEPGHVAVDVVLRARDVEDPVVVATVTFLLDELRRLGVVSVQLGPMLFQTEDVTGEVGMSRDAEFPFLGTVLRWVLTGVPMLEKYRTLQQTKRLFVPQRMEPRYLLFHPARPTPELLLAFVGALFPELSLRGLVNELVSGLTSRRKSGLESHGKEEEE